MKPLTQLLHDLEQEMLRLGYTNGSMDFYRRIWRKLLEFAKLRKETCYSEKLGIDFIEKYFQILKQDSNKRLSQSQVQKLRVIRVIGDFQLHNTILRRYYKHGNTLTHSDFISVIQQFRQYCFNKNYSKVTIGHYVKQSEHLLDYLVSQRIMDCKLITLELINAYIKTLAAYTYKTVEQNICSIRSFCRFLLDTGEISIDLAAKLPMVQARKHTNIPSVWTAVELKALIEAIDRESPKGKRDYAIVLLACCLGVRCGDIKQLKFEHFHWHEQKLIFVQSKTKSLISLPLIPEVGWAVIDYLRYGRPKVDSPYIFVRNLAPFTTFSEADHLHQIVRRYMEFAHIPFANKKRGLHSLRHTLASRLLEKDTPLPVISDILGHINPDTTSIYLKVDVQKLRECCLDLVMEKYHE